MIEEIESQLQGEYRLINLLHLICVQIIFIKASLRIMEMSLCYLQTWGYSTLSVFTIMRPTA